MYRPAPPAAAAGRCDNTSPGDPERGSSSGDPERGPLVPATVRHAWRMRGDMHVALGIYGRSTTALRFSQSMPVAGFPPIMAPAMDGMRCAARACPSSDDKAGEEETEGC